MCIVTIAMMSSGSSGWDTWGCRSRVAFAEAGEHVVAVDVDEAKISAIEAGESYIEDITSERLRAALPEHRRRRATSRRWPGPTRC